MLCLNYKIKILLFCSSSGAPVSKDPASNNPNQPPPIAAPQPQLYTPPSLGQTPEGVQIFTPSPVELGDATLEPAGSQPSNVPLYQGAGQQGMEPPGGQYPMQVCKIQQLRQAPVKTA